VTRIFQNKPFKRFADKENLKTEDLQQAISNAEQGLIDADLGGGVIKQRIACNNKGKSGGYRTIVIFKKGNSAFFVYGFAKSNKANIDSEELKAFKGLAKLYLSLSDSELNSLVADEKLIEITGF
jgi:hypothetical protein